MRNTQEPQVSGSCGPVPGEVGFGLSECESAYVALTNLKVIQVYHSIDSHHFLSSLSYPGIDVLVDTITRTHERI